MIDILGTEADDVVDKVQLKIEKSKIYKNLLDYLIENFERYKSEVKGELKTIPNNQFLPGKLKV